MYKRNAQGWSKHLDFMLFDVISLMAAYIIAILLRRTNGITSSPFYRNLAMMMILVDVLVLVLNNTMHNVFSRGYYVELIATFKHCFFVFAIVTILLFVMKYSSVYSRIIVVLTFVFHFAIGYGLRILWKQVLKRRNNTIDLVILPAQFQDQGDFEIQGNINHYLVILLLFVLFALYRLVLAVHFKAG